ncbi:MAG TPA: glycosyl transferase family 2 [Erysipelotrichaceae bacterium]|nr:glycosyl transferase family 2 [Erysipelotrichaceae bacterium]
MEHISKEKNFVSIVAYVHNNQNEISSFYLRIHKLLSENFIKSEIIFISDFTTDNSIDIIHELSKDSEIPVSIVRFSKFHGLELAMTAGVDLSIGDFVFEIDSVYDNYDFDLILKAYFRSLEGFDIVSASPTNKLRLSSKLFYYIYNSNSSNINKLKTESFRVISRRAINRIQSLNISIPYRKAVYSNSGLKTDTIYYSSKANSQYNSDIRTKGWLAIDSIILFTDFAFKFSFFLTSLMMIGTLSIIFYSIYIYLLEKPIEGWTTTMLLISGGFFGIFLIFTIIIKYLSLLLDLVFKKQNYIIESIEKHGK